jgi:hypothetical protein
MQTYISNGFRSVQAASMKEAAQIFAGRQARKEFGKSATVRTLNVNAHATDNSFAEYQAFIGRSTGIHETTGHNFSFTVSRA